MTYLDSHDVQALGWTLVHFLWQGTALAVLLASLNLLLRHAAPQVRYLLAAATLLAMVLAPVATFALVRPATAPAFDTTAVAPAEDCDVEAAAAATATPPGGGLLPPVPELRRSVEGWLPGLVALWGVGVLALSLRSLGGWALVMRLKRSRLSAPPAGVEAALARLVEALRVSAPVQIYQSALVQVPTVIGWLRPVILVPVSALAGLTPQQLELILAHELAHVRRADYFVNLLQTAVETLLFYHPAVWWASHRMRIEREHCCDDLAVAACGNPVRYARALADLEGLCSETHALAMAASGGSLLERVSRLVGPPRHLSRASRGFAALLVAGSLPLAIGVASSLLGLEGGASVSAAALVRPLESDVVASPRPQEPPKAPADSDDDSEPVDEPEDVTEPALGSGLEPPMGPPTGSEPPIELPDEGAAPRAHPALPNPPAPPGPMPARSPRSAAKMPAPPPHPQPRPKADSAPRAEASGKPRAFPLERILELARAGVTPEYIDAMDSLGYKTLSPERLIALRSQGVGPDYVKDLRDAGYADLSTDQLLSLRAQGVSASYVREMKEQGLTGLSISDLIALRAQGVNAEGVAELKKSGYNDLSVSKLIALRTQGVTGSYVAELRALGYEGLSTGKLMALRSQGVTPEYVRELAALGYKAVEVPMLLALRSQGVTPEYVHGLRDAGYSGLPAGALIELRSAGVTPEFVREMKEAGFDKLTPEELIELRHNGVRGDLLKRLRGRL